MLPPFELDVHTHTLVSGHAYGTIREMAQAAADRGLKLLGFAEHGPGIAGTCDPIYFAALEHAPRVLYGVELFYGCEINVLEGGKLSLPERYMDMIDYGVVGIHQNCYVNQGREINTDDLISCMKHPRVFLVSHPDDDHTPLDYERLVPAAKEYHVALCVAHQVPILVDSDAHDPLEVGELSQARQLLEQLDFPQELILSIKTERFKQFIGRP